MTRTKIDWADFTWNPVVGCTHGCPYCYARRIAARFHMTADFSVPEWRQRSFERPFPRKASRIFVNSMSDLADWDSEWFDRVTARIAMHPQHRFLFLTKRLWACPWTSLPNAMLGYTVTRQADCEQLDRRGGWDVSFLSIEPILEGIWIPEHWQPRWIIVGGETGNRKGKVHPELRWLYDIHGFARQNDVPLFFKDSLRQLWGAKGFPREFPV